MATISPKRRKLHHNGDTSKDQPAVAKLPTEDGAAHHPTFPAHKQNRSAANSRVKNHTPLDSNGYTGDLLQLQIAELLEELAKTRKRRLTAATDHLHRLKSAIESLDDRSPVSPTEGERILWSAAKIAVPYPSSRPDKSAKYTVSYLKPTRVNVVGSFAVDTAFVETRGVPTIDLAVTMPATLFQDKDFLNYRYFVKRAFYLASLAAGIDGSELGLSLQYGFQNSSHLQPIIIACPLDASLKSLYCIRIILACAANFPISKTLPIKSCIRNETGGAILSYTPIYNATLRAECSVEPYLKLLHSARTTSPSFSKACVLIAIWLRQRGLGSNIEEGGFGPFEASVLMALLLQSGDHGGRPLLSGGYSHFQLFKAILQLLASRDLLQNPLLLGDIDSHADSGPGPSIWDGSRGINICYKMSKDSYSTLQAWARSSIAAFGAPAETQLDSLFMRRCDTAQERFDDVFDLLISTSSPDPPLESEGLSAAVSFARKVHPVLAEALGVRAVSIHAHALSSISPWSLRSAFPSQQASQIRIGLELNAAHIHRAVDRGPRAEDKVKATAFRQLWGEKAELRRFQDSSILESVVWDEGDEALAVHRQAVDHICQRHFKQKPKYTVLDLFARDLSQEYASNSLVHMNSIWRSYDELQSIVRNLERLPLQVRNFLPISYTIENVADGDQRLDSMEIGLQFEGTARWPEDLVAIQRTKIAFLAKIQSLLQSSHTGYRCMIYQENKARPLLNCAWLEVAPLDTHHRFRIRIFHERETSLLSGHLRKAESSLEREAFSDALLIYNRDYIRKPAHVQAIRRLCLRHPLLLPTIMLFRKWCSAHLLEPHLAPELQDLIVAAIFTQPEPFSAPVNAGVGLLRVLKYLAKWDWWNEPLIVDLGDMSSILLQEATTRFDAWRKIDPGLNRTVFFAASNLDIDGTTWTQRTPTRPVAARLTALASAAVTRVDIGGISAFDDIFSTGTGDYDFLIHLKPVSSGHDGHASERQNFKNLPKTYPAKVGSKSINVSHLFIQDVSEMFADATILFHDWAGRTNPVVAGIWKPLQPRQWRTSLDYSTVPGSTEKTVPDGAKNDTLLALNRTAVLNEIARLGGDLILNIEARQS